MASPSLLAAAERLAVLLSAGAVAPVADPDGSDGGVPVAVPVSDDP